ncbi:MAG: hypothetical protein IJR87_10140 [Bacteroidaceae bacterium]|nr:hypothetical protein [Bacteroidaceae bacterium]
MRKKVEVTFEMQSDKSFSCIVDYEFPKYGLIGYGSTAREAEADVFTALRETKELLGEDEVHDIEITFRKFDVGSFFSFYPFFNVTQFARYAGMNAAQVRQYASGTRRPTAQKKEQLNAAITSLIETLSSDSRAFRID